MTAIEWQLFVAALGYWHSDKVLTHQQQYPYNSRQQRNNSDINSIPHNEHVFVLLIHWVTQVVTTYMKDCIGLVQLPNTKPDTIFVAIRDILIRVLCQLAIGAWRCNTFTKNHVSNSMDHHSFILSTLKYY